LLAFRCEVFGNDRFDVPAFAVFEALMSRSLELE
jgi:hypothetical protein